MYVGSPTAGTLSSSQLRPDNEFETDRARLRLPHRQLLHNDRILDLDPFPVDPSDQPPNGRRAFIALDSKAEVGASDDGSSRLLDDDGLLDDLRRRLRVGKNAGQEYADEDGDVNELVHSGLLRSIWR